MRTERTTQDQVAIVLALTVAGFVALTLGVMFVLASQGQAPENLWSALFALMTAVLGALAGWLGGTAVAGRKNSTPPES